MKAGIRLALLSLCFSFSALARESDAGFVLSEDCPPGFELAVGQCELRSLHQMYPSLAAFQTSVISLNSRYDQYAHGYAKALIEPGKEGMNIFPSFVARSATERWGWKSTVNVSLPLPPM